MRGASRLLRTLPSARTLARLGAAATATSSKGRALGGRRRRMLAIRAACSPAGQQSLRLSTSRRGLPLAKSASRASSSTLVRSPSSTSSTRSAPRATRPARRARPAAAISSMPGVSTSSTRCSPAMAWCHGWACWWRVQPWATSVAKAAWPSRALSRLDLPTPTRPNTATLRCWLCRRSNWRSKAPRRPSTTECSLPLSTSCWRHCSSSRRQRMGVEGSGAIRWARWPAGGGATSRLRPPKRLPDQSRPRNHRIHPPPRAHRWCRAEMR